MKNLIVILFLILIGLWYLSFCATRLDRLHHRVETSWANLDGLLQRRAAIALEIAHSDFVDPASSLLLTAAAYQARDASIKNRSQAESGLSGALGLLLSTGENDAGIAQRELLHELSLLTEKIKVAVSIHVNAVSSTQNLRKTFIFRTFRLAGSAPLPVTYEFEADDL